MSKKFKEEIKVFTDGSFSKSRDGIKCGYGVHFPDEELDDIANKFDDKPTNQRAELYAIYKAIKIVSKNYDFDKLNVYTDSKYSIDSLTVWIKNWKKNGWQTAGNKDVLNQDIIKKIDKYLTKHKNKVIFTHVKAHTGKQDEFSVCNDVVDKLAKRGGAL